MTSISRRLAEMGRRKGKRTSLKFDQRTLDLGMLDKKGKR